MNNKEFINLKNILLEYAVSDKNEKTKMNQKLNDQAKKVVQEYASKTTTLAADHDKALFLELFQNLQTIVNTTEAERALVPAYVYLAHNLIGCVLNIRDAVDGIRRAPLLGHVPYMLNGLKQLNSVFSRLPNTSTKIDRYYYWNKSHPRCIPLLADNEIFSPKICNILQERE